MDHPDPCDDGRRRLSKAGQRSTHPGADTAGAFMGRPPLAEGRLALALCDRGRSAALALMTSPLPSTRHLALPSPDHRQFPRFLHTCRRPHQMTTSPVLMHSYMWLQPTHHLLPESRNHPVQGRNAQRRTILPWSLLPLLLPLLCVSRFLASCCLAIFASLFAPLFAKLASCTVGGLGTSWRGLAG